MGQGGEIGNIVVLRLASARLLRGVGGLHALQAEIDQVLFPVRGGDGHRCGIDVAVLVDGGGVAAQFNILAYPQIDIECAEGPAQGENADDGHGPAGQEEQVGLTPPAPELKGQSSREAPLKHDQGRSCKDKQGRQADVGETGAQAFKRHPRVGAHQGGGHGVQNLLEVDVEGPSQPDADPPEDAGDGKNHACQRQAQPHAGGPLRLRPAHTFPPCAP